ncbi:hypothetical protein PR048_030799 [Dryococelus australis]|uniref:Uncharacterized protein n=1 Tax=Dryococelus australis TaxID=614101 RepID=A0ABQ9G9X2_9NEOP|nr:hypothetical protein PR048_030799 [Dryococelus australis]
MQGRGKREIPEKIGRPAASWKLSSLATTPPRPHAAVRCPWRARLRSGGGPTQLVCRKRPLLPGGGTRLAMSPTKRTVLSILARARAAQAKELPDYHPVANGGGGNWRSPRKPADQRRRPVRFPQQNVWERPLRESKPASPLREANRLTTEPPRPTGYKKAMRDTDPILVAAGPMEPARLRPIREPGSIPGWGLNPNFWLWVSCRTMPLVGGFLRDIPFPPAISFWRCSILTTITLIGSQDLAVNSRQKFFHSHSLTL